MDVRVGDLIEAGRGVLTRQWAWLLASGLVVAAVQKGPSLMSMDAALTSVSVMLSQFIIHAIVARNVLEREGLVLPGTPARYGQYLLVCIIATLGVLLGVAVLVVPGIMALLRWFLATNYVLAQGMSCTQALAASRDATRGHRWTIVWAWLAVAVIVMLPYLVIIWAAGGVVALTHASVLSGPGAARLIWAAAATPVSLAFSIGSFSVLARAHNPLREVFA